MMLCSVSGAVTVPFGGGTQRRKTEEKLFLLRPVSSAQCLGRLKPKDVTGTAVKQWRVWLPMTSWMWGKAVFFLIMPNQSDFFTINASETISQCMYAFIGPIYTLLYLKLASGLTEHQTGYKNKNTKTIIHTSDQFSQMFCKHGWEGHRHTSGLRPTLWQSSTIQWL